MFERYTDRARQVIVFAQEEARGLNHNYIGTEHILLGLICEGKGVGFQVLEPLGVSLQNVREKIEEIIGRGHSAPKGHIPFTPRAKRVFELSLREALQVGHEHIGTEHIMLALIREGEGVGAQALQNLSVDLLKVRTEVLRTIESCTIAPTTEGGQPQPELLPLDEDMERIMLQARREAIQQGHQKIGVIHLLVALFSNPAAKVADLLRRHRQG